MPTYEYRCSNGHHFDAMQRMADAPLTSCEVCEAPVQRVLHAPAIHFKGSGFHNTDYGTAKRNREKESSDGAGGDDKGAGAKDGGEVKKEAPKADAPAPKAEPKTKPAAPASSGSGS